jgi:hypothetical protein
MASISSKKMIAGAAARARRKTAASDRSLSPSHLLSSSGPWKKDYYVPKKIRLRKKETKNGKETKVRCFFFFKGKRELSWRTAK